MSDDKNSDLHAWIEPEMEARIVAAILGEASDFERDELERLMNERPELRVFKRRLEAVHGLIGDAVATHRDPEWRLGSARRAELLEAIGGPAEEGGVTVIPGETARERRIGKAGRRVLAMAAACFLLTLVLAWMLSPLLLKSESDAGAAGLRLENASWSDDFEPDATVRSRLRAVDGGTHPGLKTVKGRETDERPAAGMDVPRGTSSLERTREDIISELAKLRSNLAVNGGGVEQAERQVSHRNAGDAWFGYSEGAMRGAATEPVAEKEMKAAYGRVIVRDSRNAPSDDPFAADSNDNSEMEADPFAADLGTTLALKPQAPASSTARVIDESAPEPGVTASRAASAEPVPVPEPAMGPATTPAPTAEPAAVAMGGGGGGGGIGAVIPQAPGTVTDHFAHFENGDVPEVAEIDAEVAGEEMLFRHEGRRDKRQSGGSGKQVVDLYKSAEKTKRGNADLDLGREYARTPDNAESDQRGAMENSTLGPFGSPSRYEEGNGAPDTGAKSGTSYFKRDGGEENGRRLVEREERLSRPIVPSDMATNYDVDNRESPPGREVDAIKLRVAGEAQPGGELSTSFFSLADKEGYAGKEASGRTRMAAPDDVAKDEGRSEAPRGPGVPDPAGVTEWGSAAGVTPFENGQAGQDKDGDGRVGAVLQANLDSKLGEVEEIPAKESKKGRSGADPAPEAGGSSPDRSALSSAGAIADGVIEQGVDLEGTVIAAGEAGNRMLLAIPDAPQQAANEAARRKNLEDMQQKLAQVTAALGDETAAGDEPFSTFSLHVSDVSFKLAHAALANGQWPDAERVRIEEFVNALDYGDPAPSLEEKVACQVEQAVHPFLQQRNLVRISMRTAALGRNAATPLRLTLLLDNSGSMDRADRVESVQNALRLLAAELNPQDEVTLLSFARTPRLLREGVKGDQAAALVDVVRQTPSEGGTNLESALRLGLEKARDNFLDGAQNRIVLLTDGAANLGNAQPAALAAMVEAMRQEGIAFDACGVGAEGLNDEVLESLTRKGDGRYYFLDRPEDADAGFAKQIAGALRPAAKNVKVQVEFNPERVGKYRLLGFEKHRLEKEDFRNDSVDAAEMAAEEEGVAVYQVETLPEGEGDVGTVSVRFRDMESGRMVERKWTIAHESNPVRVENAGPSLRLAASAAMLAEKLKGSGAGEVVDLAEVERWTRSLQAVYPRSQRVRQLFEMTRQAREMAP
ncbi:MAG: DUF3520 domain-containing protein [Akkermansiaceae bacterium]|nr:DUF3520 domain-containing protein [Akkermansiaceae bacterium]